MPRHRLTREEQARGGKNQPRSAKVEGGKKGFETTMERYPFMARHWLKYAPGMKKWRKHKGEFCPEAQHDS